jgi:hypothetical protein
VQAKTQTAGREALLQQQLAEHRAIVDAQRLELEGLYRQASAGTGVAAGAGRVVIGGTGAVRSSVGSSGTYTKTQRNENDTTVGEDGFKWGPELPPVRPDRDEGVYAEKSEVQRKSRPVRRSHCT